MQNNAHVVYLSCSRFNSELIVDKLIDIRTTLRNAYYNPIKHAIYESDKRR